MRAFVSMSLGQRGYKHTVLVLVMLIYARVHDYVFRAAWVSTRTALTRRWRSTAMCVSPVNWRRRRTYAPKPTCMRSLSRSLSLFPVAARSILEHSSSRFDSIRYVNPFVLQKNRPFDSPVVIQFFLLIYCIVSVLWHCWLGGRKGIRSVKKWVVGCWRGYLSGARCRLAYSPADATAIHCLLLQ